MGHKMFSTCDKLLKLRVFFDPLFAAQDCPRRWGASSLAGMGEISSRSQTSLWIGLSTFIFQNLCLSFTLSLFINLSFCSICTPLSLYVWSSFSQPVWTFKFWRDPRWKSIFGGNFTPLIVEDYLFDVQHYASMRSTITKMWALTTYL